jgi:tetratricopeptide (TPR) repeat protein
MVGAACLALCYLIGRTVAVGMSPQLAAVLPPFKTDVVLRSALKSLLIPGQDSPPMLHQLAQRAAVESPLAFEPFFVEAKRREDAGDLPGAIVAMEEARRRNSKYLPTRLQLADYYARSGRIPEMLAEFDFLMQVSPALKDRTLPELVKLLRSRRGREALATMLGAQPTWRNDFFQVAQRTDVKPADALDLMRLAKGLDPSRSLTDERALYAHTLATSGQYREAKAEWINARKGDSNLFRTLVFDGDFAAHAGGGPFSWRFEANEAGSARAAGKNGRSSKLEAFYFGSSRIVLASQLLVLPPGNFEILLRGQLLSRTGGGALAWSISCLPNRSELARITLDTVNEREQTLGRPFAVPSDNCAGQHLELIGEPGELTTTIGAAFDKVEVRRVG